MAEYDFLNQEKPTLDLMSALGLTPEDQEEEKRKKDALQAYLEEWVNESKANREKINEIYSRDNSYYNKKASDTLMGGYGVKDYSKLPWYKKAGLGFIQSLAGIGRGESDESLTNRMARDDRDYELKKALEMEKIQATDQRAILANQMKGQIEGDRNRSRSALGAKKLEIEGEYLKLKTEIGQAQAAGLNAKAVKDLADARLKEIEAKYNLPPGIGAKGLDVMIARWENSTNPEEQNLAKTLKTNQATEILQKGVASPGFLKNLYGVDGGGQTVRHSFIPREVDLGNNMKGTKIFENTFVSEGKKPNPEAQKAAQALFGQAFPGMKLPGTEAPKSEPFNLDQALAPSGTSYPVPKKVKSPQLPKQDLRPGESRVVEDPQTLAVAGGVKDPDKIYYTSLLPKEEGGEKSIEYKLDDVGKKVLGPLVKGDMSFLTPAQKAERERYAKAVAPGFAEVRFNAASQGEEKKKIQTQSDAMIGLGQAVSDGINLALKGKLKDVTGLFGGTVDAWARQQGISVPFLGIGGDKMMPEEGALRTNLTKTTNYIARFDTGAQINQQELHMYPQFFGTPSMSADTMLNRVLWSYMLGLRKKWFTDVYGQTVGAERENDFVQRTLRQTGYTVDPIVERVKKIMMYVNNKEAPPAELFDIEDLYKDTFKSIGISVGNKNPQKTEATTSPQPTMTPSYQRKRVRIN